MMSLLRVTILVILGVVTSQNHAVNSQIPYKEMIRKRSVEATTVIPPDPHIEDEGMRMLLTRLESLCIEKLEYLITDTNTRFQFLENQSSEVHSTVNNIGDKFDRIDDPLTRLEKKLDNLTMEVGRMSQCCSVTATAVDQNNKNLEAKMDNVGKDIENLMDATRNLPSVVEMIKRNVSSLINVTRSWVDLSSNSELKQIVNEGIQKPKDLKTVNTTSYPINITLDKQYPRNCREVQESGKAASGIYMIQPEHASKPFEVVCDLETRGGGWTVIQKRFDLSQDFFLYWQDYKNGFGSLRGEFWLGLENIHLLTGFEVNELLIELGDIPSQNISALYSEFNVGSETEGYSLKVLGAYSGDAGGSLSQHSGSKFSTTDNDQDGNSRNCAQYSSGGWWYHASGCANSNLNGQTVDRSIAYGTYYKTVFWYNNYSYHSFKYTRMSVRPKV